MFDPQTRRYRCERPDDHSGNPALFVFFAIAVLLALCIGGLGNSAIDAQAHRDPNATGVVGWVEQADSGGVQRGRIVWPWEDLRTARVTRD
jgi:hypothetical protein